MEPSAPGSNGEGACQSDWPAKLGSADFIASSAAAMLHGSGTGMLDHAVAGQPSPEGAHGRSLKEVGKEPIPNLGMCLGEGTGADSATGVLKGAIACHPLMAFAETGVWDKQSDTASFPVRNAPPDLLSK